MRKIVVELYCNWINLIGNDDIEKVDVSEFKEYLLSRIKVSYPQFTFRIFDKIEKVDFIRVKMVYEDKVEDSIDVEDSMINIEDLPDDIKDYIKNSIELVKLIINHDFPSYYFEYLQEIDEIEDDLNSLANKDKRIKVVNLGAKRV